MNINSKNHFVVSSVCFFLLQWTRLELVTLIVVKHFFLVISSIINCFLAEANLSSVSTEVDGFKLVTSYCTTKVQGDHICMSLKICLWIWKNLLFPARHHCSHTYSLLIYIYLVKLMVFVYACHYLNKI